MRLFPFSPFTRPLGPAMCAVLFAATLSAATPPPEPLRAFLDRHCYNCHDADEKKGDLDLTAQAFNLSDPANFQKWRYVFDRVHEGEMPPKKKTQPAPDERAAFLDALRRPLLSADQSDIAARGRVRGRRLTRNEYEHTLHDLLGIDLPLKPLLPEDPSVQGFETVAEGQQLSHHLLARYLDVADQALREAFQRALSGDVVYRTHYTPEMLMKNPSGNFRGPELRDGRSIAWPMGLAFYGRTPTWVPEAGWYRITLRGVQAINPGAAGAVWGTLRSGEAEANAPLLHLIGLVEATASSRDIVFEAWMQKNHRLEFKPNDNTLKRPPPGRTGGNVSYAGRDLAAEGFAGIAHRGIDIERIHPHANQAGVRERLFADANPEQLDAATLDRLVARFADRAFRRPVTADQLAPYLKIARAARGEGAAPADALRTAYRAILCSPRFLTLVEAPGRLDDHAIAARLSYAFWCSLPDETLRSHAASGRLRVPAVLAAEVDRLLNHPHARRFVVSFTNQWLKLGQIDFTTPDTRLFREFDPIVQESMVQETRAYFTELLRADLGSTYLVDSDFAFLNGRLARHYRVNAAIRPGEGLQKVALQPGDRRGGFITQGAILKVTADGTSTSPVTRGVFINERILGVHIPPPPPGVPAIEPDIRGAVSIRDQLDKHRNSESCASCHQKIDPPGFALENYDPVGVWRTNYGQGGKGVKVSGEGITPDGAKFSDVAAWQRLQAQRGRQLARGFAGQFLVYATGAPLRFSDEAAIDAIAARTTGLRSLIREVVLSGTFLIK
ncbi:MAG: DUF1592 domain-containing protein [Opitutaceae bacterium]|nr:DUF1592 domain-containing protein [Opitutaceae bacterium]